MFTTGGLPNLVMGLCRYVDEVSPPICHCDVQEEGVQGERIYRDYLRGKFRVIFNTLYCRVFGRNCEPGRICSRPSELVVYPSLSNRPGTRLAAMVELNKPENIGTFCIKIQF